MALTGSPLKEYAEVAGVELDFAFCATSLSRVSLFGARDAASECNFFTHRVSSTCLSQTILYLQSLTLYCISGGHLDHALEWYVRHMLHFLIC